MATEYNALVRVFLRIVAWFAAGYGVFGTEEEILGLLLNPDVVLVFSLAVAGLVEVFWGAESFFKSRSVAQQAVEDGEMKTVEDPDG